MHETLDLGERLERFVAEQVRSGRYADAGAVIRAGLLLLERTSTARDEQLAGFRNSIEDALAGGPAREIDFDELRAEARRRLAGAVTVPSDAR